MDSSTKRKVGAIALIVAGIGAFLVPFLLHGPALQASNTNGGGTTPTGSTCTTNCTPPITCTTNCNPPSTCTTNCSTDTTPSGCTSDTSTNSHSGDNNEGKQVANGHDNQDRQDKQDTSLVGQAHSFMAALGKHNPLHDATHSTKTDNDTTNNQGFNSNNHDTEDTNACADNKDNESSDNQGNDD
jgi:hypothetical protein